MGSPILVYQFVGGNGCHPDPISKKDLPIDIRATVRQVAYGLQFRQRTRTDNDDRRYGLRSWSDEREGRLEGNSSRTNS